MCGLDAVLLVVALLEKQRQFRQRFAFVKHVTELPGSVGPQSAHFGKAVDTRNVVDVHGSVLNYLHIFDIDFDSGIRQHSGGPGHASSEEKGERCKSKAT